MIDTPADSATGPSVPARGALRNRRSWSDRGSLLHWAFVTAAAALPAGAYAQTLEDAIDLHVAGRFEDALGAYRAVALDQVDADPVGAGIAHNNACLILIDRGEYGEALQDCEAARPLLQGDDEADLRAQNLNNLGVVYQNLARFEDAERDLRAAFELNGETDWPAGQAINLGNLGALAMVRGRYAESTRLHAAAERLATTYIAEPWAFEQQQIARINRGVVLEKLGEYRQALDLYRDALAAAEGVLPARTAALRVNIGVVYRNLGDPLRALEEIRAASVIFEETDDRAGLSNAYLNLGLVYYLNLDQLVEAETALRHALALASAADAVTERIQDLFYLGQVLLARRNDEEAEQVFRACLRLASASGSVEGQWSAMDGLAQIEENKGNLHEALAHLKQAMVLIERLRSGLDAPTQPGFFGDKRAIYSSAIRVLWGLRGGRPNPAHERDAYSIAQRAKARALLTALGTTEAPVVPASAEQVRARLGDDLLLEYFLGGDNAYLWALEQDAMTMVDLGEADGLRADAATIYGALASGNAPPAEPLERLGQRLLGVPTFAGGSDRRLHVAADQALAYVPFELLPVPGSGSALMVDRMNVSYVASGSMLARARPGASPARDLDVARFLGFADPQSERVAGGGEWMARRFDLSPLPHARQELQEAAQATGGTRRLFVGDEATEAAVREAGAIGASVLHLGTHAVVDHASAGGSAIVLAQAGDDDGLLHAREIAALDLRVKLAVLAACRTAIAPRDEGGGLASLTGAFLAAGADAVVATLWDVDDQATAAFMQQFYYYLGRGVDADRALRQAKRRLRAAADWDRPAIWAAFVLTGDGSVVAVSRRPIWMLALAALAAITLGLVVVRLGLQFRNQHGAIGS